jgi:hypothetical protein
MNTATYKLQANVANLMESGGNLTTKDDPARLFPPEGLSSYVTIKKLIQCYSRCQAG